MASESKGTYDYMEQTPSEQVPHPFDVLHREQPALFAELQALAATLAAKGHDYGGTGDPLSNLRACSQIGVVPWKGVFIRMTDKWSRLVQLVGGKGEAVKSEPLDDTLQDLAAYALLCRVLRKEAGL